MSGRGFKRKANDKDGPPNKKQNYVKSAKREPQIFMKKGFIQRDLLNVGKLYFSIVASGFFLDSGPFLNALPRY